MDLFFVLAKLSALQKDANVNNKIFCVVLNAMGLICIATNKQKYYFFITVYVYSIIFKVKILKTIQFCPNEVLIFFNSVF
jgi:hypothetical protein